MLHLNVVLFVGILNQNLLGFIKRFIPHNIILLRVLLVSVYGVPHNFVNLDIPVKVPRGVGLLGGLGV